MKSKELNPYFKTLLSNVNTRGKIDKYGRFYQKKGNFKPNIFPKTLYYTNSGSFEGKCNMEYSFDAMVFDDFRYRTEDASRIFGKDLGNSLLYCTLNHDDENFSLKTRLWLPYALMPDIYTFLDFIEDIELEQSRVLEINSRNNFLQSTKKLRDDKVSLTEIYQSNDVFERTYEFDPFSLIFDGSIRVYGSQGEGNWSSKEIHLGQSPVEILTDLNDSGIMEFNQDTINDLKDQTRLRFIQVDENESTDERLKRYASFFSSSKEVDPILSIDPFDFEGTFKQLNESGFISKEGLFEIEKNHQFLEDLVKKLTNNK